MTAYVIANIQVHDAQKMQAYSQMATPIVVSHGGRYLARGGRVHVLEGSPKVHRTVVLAFPNVEAALAWWNSPAYSEAKALREAAASTELIVVEGLE